MRPSAVALLLCTLALAGCAEEAGPEPLPPRAVGGEVQELPPAVTQVLVRSVGHDNATLQWTVVGDVEGLVSFVEYGVGVPSLQSDRKAGAGERNITIRGLAAETEYVYQVALLIGATGASRTLEARFTTEPAPPDPATDAGKARVEDITVESVTADKAVIFYRIAGGSGAIAHLVQYGGSTDYARSTELEKGRGAFRVVLGPLASGVTYHFRVQVLHGAAPIFSPDGNFTTTPPPGDGGPVNPNPTPTNSPTPTPTPTPGPDTQPPGLGVPSHSGIHDTSVSIQWSVSDNSGSATSSVQYGLPGMFDQASPSVVGVGQFTTVLGGLTAGTTYEYRIYAVDGAGNEILGAPKTFSTTSPPAPDTQAPVISSVNGGATGTTTALISWSVTDNQGMGFSRVEYDTVPGLGSASLSANQNGAGGKSASLAGLTPDTTYYFRVYAEDLAGNVATSAVQSFQTQPVPPPAISAISSSSPTTSGFTVHWTISGPSDTQSYVEYATNPSFTGSSSTTAVAGTGAKSAVLTGLASGTTYHFRIQATASSGSPTSATLTQATAEVIAATITGCCGAGTIAPLNLAGKAGKPLIFEVTNSDGSGLQHTWRLYQDSTTFAGPTSNLNMGQSQSVPAAGTVTLSAGSYSQQCTIHPGMIGSFTIS